MKHQSRRIGKLLVLDETARISWRNGRFIASAWCGHESVMFDRLSVIELLNHFAQPQLSEQVVERYSKENADEVWETIDQFHDAGILVSCAPEGDSPIALRISTAVEEAKQAFGKLFATRSSADEEGPCEISAGVNAIEGLVTRSLSRFGSELDAMRCWARFRMEQAFFPSGEGYYDWLEAQVLYLLIRITKPEVVLEIAPNYGYTTGFILAAMNKNDKGRLFSFDMEQEYYAKASDNFMLVGLDDSRQSFFAGDVRETIDAVSSESFDLIFMDAEHSYSFGQWYLENLLPRLKKGGLLHVDDVRRHGITSYPGDAGEGKALWEFLQKNSVDARDFLYLNDEYARSEILRQLQRYPFPGTTTGTNACEANPAFWLLKTRDEYIV